MKVKVSWKAGEKVLELDERFYCENDFVDLVQCELQEGHETLLLGPEEYTTLYRLVKPKVEAA